LLSAIDPCPRGPARQHTDGPLESTMRASAAAPAWAGRSARSPKRPSWPRGRDIVSDPGSGQAHGAPAMRVVIRQSGRG